MIRLLNYSHAASIEMFRPASLTSSDMYAAASEPVFLVSILLATIQAEGTQMPAILLTTYLFATPPVENSLNDVTGFPFRYAFKQATSTAGVNGLKAIILLAVYCFMLLGNWA